MWLMTLPPTDPAFEPAYRAKALADEADWRALWSAHREAVRDAADGADVEALEERAEMLHDWACRLKDRDDDGSDARHVHAAEIEALGYALGVTAVRVAIRNRAKAVAA